eukprot:359927-Chlamydomonas_euryale.AAC.7
MRLDIAAKLPCDSQAAAASLANAALANTPNQGGLLGPIRPRICAAHTSPCWPMRPEASN